MDNLEKTEKIKKPHQDTHDYLDAVNNHNKGAYKGISHHSIVSAEDSGNEDSHKAGDVHIYHDHGDSHDDDHPAYHDRKAPDQDAEHAKYDKFEDHMDHHHSSIDHHMRSKGFDKIDANDGSGNGLHYSVSHYRPKKNLEKSLENELDDRIAQLKRVRDELNELSKSDKKMSQEDIDEEKYMDSYDKAQNHWHQNTHSDWHHDHPVHGDMNYDRSNGPIADNAEHHQHTGKFRPIDAEYKKPRPTDLKKAVEEMANLFKAKHEDKEEDQKIIAEALDDHNENKHGEDKDEDSAMKKMTNCASVVKFEKNGQWSMEKAETEDQKMARIKNMTIQDQMAQVTRAAKERMQNTPSKKDLEYPDKEVAAAKEKKESDKQTQMPSRKTFPDKAEIVRPRGTEVNKRDEDVKTLEKSQQPVIRPGMPDPGGKGGPGQSTPPRPRPPERPDGPGRPTPPRPGPGGDRPPGMPRPDDRKRPEREIKFEKNGQWSMEKGDADARYIQRSRDEQKTKDAAKDRIRAQEDEEYGAVGSSSNPKRVTRKKDRAMEREGMAFKDAQDRTHVDWDRKPSKVKTFKPGDRGFKTREKSAELATKITAPKKKS